MIPDKLKNMGYTEEDLEQSNPYNQWIQKTGKECPKCGETEISHCHHEGDFGAPECDFSSVHRADINGGMSNE